MSDYEDESGGVGSAAQMAKWLGLASPRELLDRTTKFVLNAAHGKSRSLIPTSDLGVHNTENFVSTGVVDWEEDEDAEEEEQEDPVQERRKQRESALAVLESEILQGRWNEYALASDSDSSSETAAGMMRVDLRRRQRQPARRRVTQQTQTWRTTAMGGGRRRISFTALPARIIARILAYLPVAALLAVTGSCRVLRRVVHRQEPSDTPAVGSTEYTAHGLLVWRALLRRMGWSIRGAHVEAPRSHTRLLHVLCGVGEASELASAVAETPDLVFKAVFDELHATYAAFRGDAWVRLVRGGRAPWAVAERLDQLRWLGQALPTADASLINRRIDMAVARLEHAYVRAFRRALVRGDAQGMRSCARVLGHLGGGACIGVLQTAALAACSADLFTHARGAHDAAAFGVFLDRLHVTVAAHARAAHRALPSWLPSAALAQFVHVLFAPEGAAYVAVQTVCAALQPVGDAEYLHGVYDVAMRLLQATARWSSLRPVG
ncbi:hypothetical protein LPJ73_003603, partial [Coemansia sp. RSA 2703]